MASQDLATTAGNARKMARPDRAPVICIDERLSLLERDILRLYRQVKTDPAAAEPFAERMEDLADKLHFTAFSAGFLAAFGRPPHTETRVMGEAA